MSSNQVNPPNCTRKSGVTACSSLVLADLVALTVQILYFFPLDPVILEKPPAPASSASPSTIHNQLQNVIKLREGLHKDPEDVCADKQGIFYADNKDGWIKRMHRDGHWENWKKTESHTLLGITTTREGCLMVCDTVKGLFKVTEDGVTVLVSQMNGSELRLADDVIEASDDVFISPLPTPNMINWYLYVLEARPHGQLHSPRMKIIWWFVKLGRKYIP